MAFCRKDEDASDNLPEKIISSSTFQKTMDAHESRKFFFHEEKILDESEMLGGLQIFCGPYFFFTSFRFKILIGKDTFLSSSLIHVYPQIMPIPLIQWFGIFVESIFPKHLQSCIINHLKEVEDN